MLACSAQLKVETYQASGRREAVQIWRFPPSNQDDDKYKYKCKNTNTKKIQILKIQIQMQKYKYKKTNTNTFTKIQIWSLFNNIFGSYSLAEDV